MLETFNNNSCRHIVVFFFQDLYLEKNLKLTQKRQKCQVFPFLKFSVDVSEKFCELDSFKSFIRFIKYAKRLPKGNSVLFQIEQFLEKTPKDENPKFFRF